MRTYRSFWISVSILLSSLGIYLLSNSIHHPGEFAEEVILVGALLTTLGGVAALFAIEQQLRRATLARHMRQSSHVSGKSISRLHMSNRSDQGKGEGRARHLTLS